MKWAVLASSIPTFALAVTPAARWGHQAVYVDSQSAMYVIGGQVSSSGTNITNEVLTLSLNVTNPSFSVGPETGLPPHAFASAALSEDESELVIVGGMTASCSRDDTTHTLTFSNSSWSSVSPSGFVRRRGAGAAWVDNGSKLGEVMVVGGIADDYVCASSVAAYTASDVLSLPLTVSALVSSRSLPKSLTGSSLAVADFALAKGTNGTLYLAGGQTSSGDLVPFSTVGVWTAATGWTSQFTSGDIPAGRLGASLVAHPTLDLLILHGGAISNGTGYSPSVLLAYLNTTSWQWSTPSNLQPPASSAVAYHTSVMTNSGVMITAFGQGPSGAASANVFYLDMRDPTGSTWSWKSVWSASMLGAYTASSSSSSSSSTSSTSGSVVAVNNAAAVSTQSKKTLFSAVIPTVIVVVLLGALITYLVRRHVRITRKRRLARHFSFSSQEDDGDFADPIAQYQAASRRTRTQYSFGRDANEKDGNMFTDMAASLVGLFRRASGSSSRRRGSDESIDAADREMSQVRRTSTGTRLDEKPKWEEIDFGLGKLDESRRSSFATGAESSDPSAPMLASVTMPVASTYRFDYPEPPLITVSGDSPRVENEGALIPSLVVAPPTPAGEMTGNVSFPAPAPAPAPESGSAPATSTDGLDWSTLQKELEERPAFRSISPTATLRSHAHQSQTSPSSSRAPSPASVVPHLPPLEFERTPSTITLVNPKTGRRTSETLPFTPRSVSQPLGRPLTGAAGRRGSAPVQESPLVGNRRASNPVVSPSVVPDSPAIGTVRRESAQSRLRVVNITETEDTPTGQAL